MKWILMLSVAGIAALGFRHVTQRGRHTISMSFLALVALLTGFFVHREWALEKDLTSAVRSVTGDDRISVNCQGFLREFRLDDNLGEVQRVAHGQLSTTAELRSSVCGELRSWIGSDKVAPSRDQVIAVHVLSHEAIHATGVSSEAETECLAMQLDEELAVALGATREQARALAQRYWREVFPRMPNEYRAVDCFEGGPLDASPDDGLWPGRSEVLAGS